MSVVGWASESLLESLGMRISRARFRWFGWLALASALAAALWAVWPQAAADPAAGEIASWSAVSEAAGEITVRWETPSPAPSDYRLNWGPADQPFPSWRDALGNEFPRDNGLTLSELTPGASYKLRLRARYNAGAYARSPWSGPWTAELVVEVADEQADEQADEEADEQADEDAQEDPPPAPTGLRAEATDGVVRLTWDDPDDASITGFRIERGPDADSLAALTQVAADQRSFADYATQASTSYLYALRALRGETAGERSQTLELLAPPAPPSGLQATLETRGVRLTWDDPLDHAVSGYRLLRRPASGDGGPAALSVPPSFRARGILDAAAQPGRAYRYSLQARNAGGWSAYAAPVLVETLGLALAGQLALARWNEPEQPRLGFDADAGQGAFRLAGAADARWIDLRSLVLRPQPERSLVLVLGQPSRRPFLLWLGGQALYSQAAASQPRGEGRAYTWSEPCLDWTDGQQVTLRLERIAPDDPRLAQLGAPTLARLSLQGARLLQPFQTRDLHYRAELDADAAQVTVELETNPLGVCGLSLEPADADPQTDGHQLEVGAEGAELRITVQGATGAQQTYTVGLAPAGQQPAGLRQLQLAGPEPIAFLPTERRYDAPLPAATEQVELTVEPAAPGQQLQGHVVRAAEFLVHEQALAEPVAVDPRGDTLVLIEVRSADGLRREPYRLRLRPATQPDAPNSSPALFSQLGGFSPTPAPRLSALSLSAGQLSPAFQPGRFDYAARVGPDVARITVGPAAADGAAWRILPADADPDTDGHQVDLYAPRQGRDAQTVVSVIVRSADSLRLDSYDVTVTREAPPPRRESTLSSDTSLVGYVMEIEGEAPRELAWLSPSNRFTVGHEVSGATLRPSLSHPRASVRIEPADADPETDGHQLSFAVGDNLIDVRVTAENGWSRSRDWFIIERPPDPLSVARLSSLSLSGAGLHPDFDSERTDYEASRTADASRVTVTAETTHPDATFTITPADADDQTDGHQVDLASGADTWVRVQVTSADATETREYAVRIHDDRVLGLSVGHLPIALEQGKTHYTLNVPEEVTEVTVGFRRRSGAEPGFVAGSGDAAREIIGHQVGLASGTTEVPVRLRGRFGTNDTTYTLAITRQTPETDADAKLSALSIDVGTAISFDPLVSWYWVSDIGDTPQSATVSATAAQTGATVSISPADADPETDGHQVAFSGERLRVVVSVTSSDGNATRTYTIAMHRRLEWADFEMGWTHGCGLRSDGRILCSGERGWGVLFSSGRYAPSAPAQYVYQDLELGRHETCGTLVNGVFHCWTASPDLYPGSQHRPHSVIVRDPTDGRPGIPEWGPLRQISMFSTEPHCWLDPEGKLGCLEITVPASLQTGAYSALAVGARLVCVLDAAGAAQCFSKRGTLVAPAGPFQSISAGSQGTACAIKTSGALLCWRYGWSQPTRSNVGSYVGGFQLVADDSEQRYTAVSVGIYGFCALRQDGALVCEQDASQDSPFVRRPSTESATFIGTSLGWVPGNHSALWRPCGLTSLGEIECWTTDRHPALTDPDWIEREPVEPERVPSDDATLQGYTFEIEGEAPRELAWLSPSNRFTVGHEVSGATLRPSLSHPRASVRIEPADADPETDGHQLSFAVGDNLIDVRVTAENGWSRSRDWFIIERPPDPLSVARLSSLSLSGAGLHPDFDSERTDYEASRTADASRVTVTAETTHPDATFTITPADADDQTDGHQVDLASGADTWVRVQVTSADATETREYAVRIHDDRVLGLSVGHLPIALEQGKTHYTLNVPEEVTEVTVGFRRRSGAEPGFVAGSGDAAREIIGHQVGLASGTTEVPVRLRGRFGTNDTTYTLAITRQTPETDADAKLSALSIDVGTAISFDPLVSWYWVSDIGDTPQSATVSATAAQTGATVSISPADADPETDGHQVVFSGERLRVVVSVTSSDGNATRTYTIAMHRRLEWADFEMGWTHGCGLRSDGRILCSGERGWGVLFSSGRYAPSAPAQYVYQDLELGRHETCGTLVNGVFHCWTASPDLYPGSQHRPHSVIVRDPTDGRPGIPEWGPLRQISMFSTEPHCWLDPEGKLGCLEITVPASLQTGAYSALAVGARLVCVLDAAGAAQCFSKRGTLVAPAGPFQSISAGSQGTACAIKTSGALLCWRYGWSQPTRSNVGSYVGGFQLVADDSEQRYTAVSVGIYGFCALRQDGALVCEQDASQDSPFVRRPSTESATFIGTSLGWVPGNHSALWRPCGLTSLGEIECWTTDRHPALTDPDWLRP